MTKYLKRFTQHADFVNFRGGGEYLVPNVSVCANENEAHYNPYYDPILKFTAEQANSTIKLNRVGTATTLLKNASLQYSLDNGETWNDYTYTEQQTTNSSGETVTVGYSGQTITLENVGDSVKFKGINEKFATYVGGGKYDYHRFFMRGKIAASGDITSLFNEVGGDIEIPGWACYVLFQYCGSLTKAPNLPSTSLNPGCYYRMFESCGLETAPELPALKTVEQCYYAMFLNCSNLKYVKALFVEITGNNSLYGILGGRVNANGTFVYNPNAWDEETIRSAVSIPSGWTFEAA